MNFFKRHRRTTLFVIFLLAGLFSGLALCAGGAAAQAQPPAKVDSMRPDRLTAEGLVIGVLHRGTNTLSWKGIPYAKPPVGDLRWKAPEEPARYAAPLKADKFCQVCPQYIDHDGNPATPNIIIGKEDCLYLNIWRPRNKATALPVFFWIHGGGNSIQWPLASDTDAFNLAKKADIIVVTINYRLGPLGFFSHPSLRSGAKGNEKTDSGNFTLLDIIQALTWVKNNIASFGGDPGNVTIVGESAGGQSVISLLASPPAKGLFHRAVSQSGVIKPFTPAQGDEYAGKLIAKLLVNTGAAADEKAAAAKLQSMSPGETAAFLRARSVRELLELFPQGKTVSMYRLPNNFADGFVMPRDFYGALKSGNYNKVPVILGSNKEETKLFQMGVMPFAAWIKDRSLFKDPAKAELYNLAARYQSDGWKVMAVDDLATILRSNPDQPNVFAYHFLWGAGGMKNSVQPFPFSQIIGASHTTEIDFVFGTEAVTLGGWVFSEKNRPGRVALSNAMMDYWGQFVRTGDPNREGSGLPRWMPWSNAEGRPKTLILNADFQSLKLQMSNQVLTEAMIEKDLQAEPRFKELKPVWDSCIYRKPGR
jgi:para-nitrobenzyl esterase